MLSLHQGGVQRTPRAVHTSRRGGRLLKWLRDAYAMEQEAETMMKALASRIENTENTAYRARRTLRRSAACARSARQAYAAWTRRNSTQPPHRTHRAYDRYR
ncbi:hypothetical protein C7E12_06280 [Stenotrophomonas maltophilia]|nr:ferritin-like domain-containing protein [Stenotrophomonas maltophilia]PSD20075.1 hypothetical protein C7E14_01040 [Stenotrophomonas maltophilia]PSD30832.1 hypothetical protein C7E12_06280 [Stenotrophomonas maltophilia]